MGLDKTIDSINKIENESDLVGMTLNDNYIWPYVKNKIFGISVLESNNNRVNRSGYRPKALTFDAVKQSKNIKNQYDVLVFNFYRFHFDDNFNIVDSRNSRLINELKRQNINFAEIFCYNENQLRYPIYQSDNIYALDEMYFMDLIRFKANKVQRNYDYKEVNEIISSELSINFDIRHYENEFIRNIEYYNSYILQTLLAAKPKAIFINANVVRPYLITMAKELGILVYEVQYAAITPYHLGFDNAGKDYMFSADGLFVWGEYWKNSSFLSSNVKDIQVIGIDNPNLENVVTKHLDKTILLVSQDLFSQRFLQEAENFCKKYPDWKILYKKHPAEDINTFINNNQLNNLIFEDRPISQLTDVYTFVVGINSTALFELANMGNKIVILDDLMSNFMKDLIDSNKALLVESLCDDLDLILEYNYYNKPEFFEFESNIDFSTILNHIPNFETSLSFDVINKRNYNSLLKYNQKNSDLLIIDDLKGAIEKIDEPILSIIVPCYNAAGTIRRLIATIKNNLIFDQTKIILINDGSSDNTADVLSDLAHIYSNIIVINNLIPSGNPSYPRNCGIDIADTKYIYMVDSDDYMFENSLDKMIYYMMKYDIDLLKTGCLIEQKGKVGHISVPNKIYRKKEIQSLIKQNIFVYTHMMKTSILKDNDIRFVRKSYEDLPFMAEVYKNIDSALSINFYSVVYQKEDGTESDVNTVTKFKDLIDQRLLTLNILDKNKKDIINYFGEVYILDYIIMKINIMDFFSEMNESESSEYKKKLVELMSTISSYDVKELSSDSVLDVVQKIRDSVIFYAKRFTVENGNLKFTLYRAINNFEDIKFNETSIKSGETSIKLPPGEYKLPILRNNVKLQFKSFEKIYRGKDNILYTINADKEYLYINYRINENNYFYISHAFKQKDDFYFKLEFSSSSDEFMKKEYFLNGMRLEEVNLIKITDSPIKIFDGTGNQVGLYTLMNKFMLRYEHIEVKILSEDELKIEINYRRLKVFLKKVYFKLRGVK